MADETTIIEGDAAVPADPVAAKPKKARAPRRSKAAIDAAVAAEPAKAEKVAKERKKRGPKTAQATSAVAEKAAKPVGRRPRKAAEPTTATVASGPVSAADEMAELLLLEEENKRLRKSLAEKLRAENVDLRERLGLA